MIARSFRCLCLALALSLPACAAVFQYKVDIPHEKTKHSAFLWVPPEAPAIRGVVMAGQTLMEKAFSQDPRIRAACAEEGIAILFTTVGLKGQDLQKTLDDLAAVSGFAEISKAPLFFVGHSAGGPQALDRAKEFADRCFGLLQFRGGIPHGLPAGIPALAMMGQFDEFGGLMRREDGWEQAWMGPRRDLAKLRNENPGLLACFAAEPGAGHFPWTERNGNLFALFLKKAAATVIRADGTLHRPAPEEGLAIPMNFLPNDPADLGTAWVFDAEMARALETYHEPLGTAKKDQFIRWENRFWVDAGVRFFFHELKIVGDGQSFEVNPVYADKIPGQHNNQGPRWLEAGQPVANSGEPIHLRAIAGPIVPTGPMTFRLQHDALNPVGDIGRITFLAYSEGNREFRHTETVGMAPRGYRGPGQGADQTLDFPELEDRPAKHAPIALNATSSSGLPVEFYVAYGPAAIEDGKLVARDVPVRASGPIEVSVVAYHIGSGIDPKFKAAVPVVRTYRLLPAK